MLDATEKYLRKVGKVKRIKIISARRTSYGFPIPLIVKRIWADCEKCAFITCLSQRCWEAPL